MPGEIALKIRVRSFSQHSTSLMNARSKKKPTIITMQTRSESNGSQPEEHHTEDCAGLRELVDTLKEELARRNTQMEQLHVLLQHQAVALPVRKENRPWWRLW